MADGPWVAETAVVVGEVALGTGASVWHGAVLRGDVAPIEVGEGTNVQDNAVVHTSDGLPVRLGRDVTVGHGAILHGCEVGARSLVGMGAIVLDGARVGAGCVVGAGALVTQGTVVPDGSVAYGSPARVVRPATEAERAANLANAADYVRLARASLPEAPSART